MSEETPKTHLFELSMRMAEQIDRARAILDPENRFESLEDAARNRMQQIVALEALR